MLGQGLADGGKEETKEQMLALRAERKLLDAKIAEADEKIEKPFTVLMPPGSSGSAN